MDIQLLFDGTEVIRYFSVNCQSLCHLSRFESQAKFLLKNLLDLCQRLDMSLDVFPRQDVQSTELYQHIEAAENTYCKKRTIS